MNGAQAQNSVCQSAQTDNLCGLDLPAAELPKGAVIIHVPNLLQPKDRRVALLNRRQRLDRWLGRQKHDIVGRRTICAINGEWIPREQWKTYQPKRGDVVLLIDNPHAGGDGGSNPLAMVLMIAVMIFAPYAAPMLGLSVSTTQAIFMLGANLLISALTSPAKKPASQTQADMASPSPTYTLSAQGNANRLGSPRPRHYGRFRFTPAYCAQAYGEFVNNENYLYEIFDVGLGEYQIDKISIEDTPIENFTDITVEICPPGQAVTLVPARVHNSGEVAGQELLQGTWAGSEGGFVAVPAGSTANRIGVDYVCPYGLFLVNDEGELGSISAQIRFEARQIDDLDAPLGIWFTLGDHVISAASNTPQRFTQSYPVTPGRYAVRATRVDTKNTTTKAGHEVTWAGLRAYFPGNLVFADNTVIAMRARASGQLTEVSARRVYVQGVGKVKTWSPGAGWSVTPVASRSPAWAAADILMAKYGRNASAAAVDLDKLYQLDQVWASRGDYFDASFDTRSTVAEALTSALKVGRSVWFQIAGMFSFARDEAASVPSAVFTPNNIVRGSVEVEYIMASERTSDHVVAKYFDTEVFKWREVKATLTGNTDLKPASLTLFGIGDYDHAWREAVTLAAGNLYRRRIVKFQTEMEGRLLLPLDTIGLTHILINKGQTGEVIAFDGDDGDGGLTANSLLTLSRPLEFTAGQTHYLVMSTTTGGRCGPWQVVAGPAPEQVRLVFPIAEFQPYVGGSMERTRFAFGIGSEVYTLGKVIPPLRPKGRNVEITMAVDDPRVHTADQTNTMPPPAAGWGLPKAPERPVLASILIAQSGDPATPIITASWPETAGTLFYVVEWSQNAVNWHRAGGDTTGTSMSFSVPAGTLHVRACAVGKVAGPWVAWSGVAGEVPPPGRPQGLALVEVWLGTRARWRWSAGLRASSYEVEIHAAGVLRRSFETTALSYSYDAEQVKADGGPWREVEIKVRSKGPTGVSDWASLTSINPQVGQLSGVFFAPGYLQIVGTYNLPADTDFAGVRVAMSQTSGFDVSDVANLAYDGHDQMLVLTKDPTGAPFVAGAIWYLRIAGYDRFGTDALLWSDEHQVTIATVEADLTPEQVLERLNSSFVQGNVVISGAGAITVYNGSPSLPNRDFVALTAGTISFQRYRNGQYFEYKSLKRVETGSAPSGQTVTLPGYWDRQPKVTISPQSLRSYDAAYSNQSQTWACRADNLREDPADSGIWKFDAVAELQLASNSGTQSINQSPGDTSSNSWDSSEYTLPSNTHDITVNVQVKSKRGTGVHTSEWAYRRITITVYTYSSAGGWVQAGQVVALPGAALDTLLDRGIVCDNLPVGTDRFYVNFAAADEGGVFSTGSDVYGNYRSETIVGNNGTRGYAMASPTLGMDQNYNVDYGDYGGYRKGVYTMGSPSIGPGESVYQTSYTYNWLGRASAGGSVIAPNGAVYYGPGGTNAAGWVPGATGAVFMPMSHTKSGSYDANAIFTRSSIYMGLLTEVKDVVATVYIWSLIKNSSTPVNGFVLGNYNWQTSSASALSTGSLNYMALE